MQDQGCGTHLTDVVRQGVGRTRMGMENKPTGMGMGMENRPANGDGNGNGEQAPPMAVPVRQVGPCVAVGVTRSAAEGKNPRARLRGARMRMGMRT
jgi:hypothetical protein